MKKIVIRWDGCPRSDDVGIKSMALRNGAKNSSQAKACKPAHLIARPRFERFAENIV